MKTTSPTIMRGQRALWLCGLGLGAVALPPLSQAARPPGPVLVARADVAVTVDIAPPPPREERIVERDRPARDYVWIKGYWIWRDGRHFWVAGHWERPPRPHAVWIEPRWEHRGHGYVFVRGYWR